MKDFHNIDWTAEKISRLWAYYGSNRAYDNAYFSKHTGDRILSYIQRYVDLTKKQILDFGCGPGFFLERLGSSKTGGVFFGLDFSNETVIQARQRLSGIIPSDNIRAVESLPSPYADKSFDVILCIEVIEHLNDEQIVANFNEFSRLLKTGGYLVLTTPNRENLDANMVPCPECGCIFHRWQHVRKWDSRLLVELISKYGFETTHVGETYFCSWFRSLWHWIKSRFNGQTPPPYLIYIGRKR